MALVARGVAPPRCDRPEPCVLRNSNCPYTVRYASSSRVLVEEVLHLSRENNQHGAGAGEAVQAPIVFGCGREQTGTGAFPGGLMGLGMGKVSVPSLLASGGHVASNSFSMCFGDDGTGRINFGDAVVSPGQAQTPFILTDTPPTYKIATRGMNVENLDVPLEFDAVVDSGASFTYLAQDPCTVFAGELMSKIQDQRANLNASVPFEYCYGLSPNKTEIYIPDVSFWTKGGGKFPVTRPFFVIDDGNGAVVGYCLAILKSETGVNVFGQNFMTGLKVVFDRKRFVLGWSKFDCYRDVEMEDVGSAAPAPAPATAPGPARAYGRTV